MGMIKLNHWYARENQLCISLMKYYVSIDMVLSNDEIFFKLEVIDSERKELCLCFNSLEEAISFTEDVVNKNYSITFNDMERAYKEQYGDIKVMKKIKNRREL